jgi:transposase
MTTSDESYELFVGLDWATAKHQVCTLAADGAVLDELTIAHQAPAIHSFIESLLRRGAGRAEQVAVAIEIPRGALVETLVERGIHVYTLNPKQLDRFRDRHTVAGAKDDRRDAYVLADALRTDRSKFHRVAPDHPLVIQIRELSRADEELREEFNRLSNRVREQLYRCAPHLLALSPAADEPWVWDLAEAVLRTADGRLTRAQATKLLRRHRIRRLDADELLATLRQPRFFTAPGAAEAARAHLALLLPRLRLVYEQRKRCAKQLQELLDAYTAEEDDERDPSTPGAVTILRSLPGVGVGIAATLLAEAAPLLRQADYHGLRALGGLAPVTKRSGKGLVVLMRYSCNRRLRNACYHWARGSVLYDEAARAYYARLRARGHSHGRALRSVADRSLRILVAMLKARTLYEAHHQRRVPAAA